MITIEQLVGAPPPPRSERVMLPLSDGMRARRFPVVNVALIVAWAFLDDERRRADAWRSALTPF